MASMEQVVQLPSLTSSYSALSMAERSEVISEAEEIHEVRQLHRSGSQLFKDAEFVQALKCYNDALEIDENSIESLEGRAAVYLEMRQAGKAMADIQKLLTLEGEKPQVHFLHGHALFQLKDTRGALLAFLQVLNLDPKTEHIDLLTTNIAYLASKFSNFPASLRDNLSELEPYSKLTEVGVCLYQAKQYDLSIRVLTSAQQLETNQQGITMKLQLTLANANSQQGYSELAVSHYQELLSTAQSGHDTQYYMKALVNIASLLLELGDAHKAIVHYEKLLDLQKELQGESSEGQLPEYWSQDLQCALHLNLSTAYKAIGSIHKAVLHAETFAKVVAGCETRRQAEAHSRLNVGTLYEMLGEYTLAEQHFKAYLEKSKSQSDKKAIAQGYGCLGSVYAHLDNAKLSEIYHEQHVAIAKDIGNPKLLVAALEQSGDSHGRLGDYEKAKDSYRLMLGAAEASDAQTRAMALCKLGNSHRALEHNQHAVFCYEQAQSIAEDYGYTAVAVMCKYNLACIWQNSAQVLKIDQSRKLFQKLIPLFEAKIQQHQDEDTFCPAELHLQLQECYCGIQNALAILGNKAECLEYSEAAKKIHSPLLHIDQPSPRMYLDVWSVNKMSSMIAQQTATILYYTVLPSRLLIWVLQPDKGLMRFHVCKPKTNEPISEQVHSLLMQIKHNGNTTQLQYSCENRALPFQETPLELLKKKNHSLSVASKREEFVQRLENETSKDSQQKKPEKPVQRRLFDLLIAPMEDILSGLEPESSLIIVPDGILYHCPFGTIEDWRGQPLAERFHLTYLPNLRSLEAVVQSELNQLKMEDDLHFQRSQARMGGIPKALSQAEHMQMSKESLEEEGGNNVKMNLKRTSNPRLLTSGSKGSRGQGQGSARTRQQSFLSRPTGSTAGKMPSQGLSTAGVMTPRITPMAPRVTDTPTRLEKAVGTHAVCTLTSRTSTDTDVTASDIGITEFAQISNRQRCVVIGSPKLPEIVQLHQGEWRPRGYLKAAQAECYKVAEHLDSEALVAERASKDAFLQQLKHATVLHIATLGCLKTGVLALTPNPSQVEDNGIPPEHSYLVTMEEIAGTGTVAKLVVLSGGWTWFERGYIDKGFHLPGAFLAAGALCVLTLLWPVSNDTLTKFYHHFYEALQAGCLVTAAVGVATKALKESDRYSDVSSWCPFVLIGKDVHINLTELRHSMLDQKIDRAEEETAAALGADPLNPQIFTPNLASREENLHSLQELLSQFLAQHYQHPDVMKQLLEVLDHSLKKLHQSEPGPPTCLSDTLRVNSPARGLLHLLGFHFQPHGAYVTDPYIIYPECSADNLMRPAFEALRALDEITGNAAFSRALQELLPASQANISHLVDVLCITKHNSEIQLKVSDASVRPLWRNNRTKIVLQRLGFQQIGLLLHFNSTSSTRKLLTSGLRLFIAISTQKSSVLLQKLDVSMLGGPQEPKVSSQSSDIVKLPSLMPLLLRRNQMCITTPWLSTTERPSEMDEKLKLARSKSDLESEYKQQLTQTKTWHQANIAPQSDSSLSKVGRAKLPSYKVKVIAGASLSQPRVPLDAEPDLDLGQTDGRRYHASGVLQERLDSVALQHRNDVNSLYLPYIESV